MMLLHDKMTPRPLPNLISYIFGATLRACRNCPVTEFKWTGNASERSRGRGRSRRAPPGQWVAARASSPPLRSRTRLQPDHRRSDMSMARVLRRAFRPRVADSVC